MSRDSSKEEHSFSAALAYLHGLPDFERGTARTDQGYGLERMRALLEVLGHPDRSMRIAHIAGTKGKGSTAAMLAAMLRAAGRRTGLYTSPHLVEFSERIAVNGEQISPEAVAGLVLDVVKPAAAQVETELGVAPLHFEQELALALIHFRAHGVQDAVLEVGLGGRLDATNAVDDPAVSLITTIGYDHMQVLGHTLPEIAAEKAAIIRPGGRVVCAPQQPEALAVVRQRCRDQQATLIMVGEGTRAAGEAEQYWRAIVEHSTLEEGLQLTLEGPGGAYYRALRVALAGRHQATNAAVALAALHTLWHPATPPRQAIYEGLAGVRWPGRLQVIGHDPLVILDGAHNAESAAALAAALQELLSSSRPLTLILAMLRDKDLRAIARPLVGGSLADRVRHVLVTSSSHARAATPAQVAEAIAMAGGPSVETAGSGSEALARAYALTPPGGAIVATGSLSLVGDILRGQRNPRG